MLNYCLFGMKSRDPNGGAWNFFPAHFYMFTLIYIAMLLGYVRTGKKSHIKVSREEVSGAPIKRCPFLALIWNSKTYGVGSN